jgi:hypothetical protein
VKGFCIARSLTDLEFGMISVNEIRDATAQVRLLAELLFGPHPANNSETIDLNCLTPQTCRYISDSDTLRQEELQQLESLAAANHVLLRSFCRVATILGQLGHKHGAARIAAAVEREQNRINHALNALNHICSELDNHGCPVTVIKSLDHWPDLGSDLDLYTDAHVTEVKALMVSRFDAKVEPQSWGDRLANKWNFRLPHLPELVEVHAGRLGQMGEHAALTRSLTERSRQIALNSHRFRVPAPEDRIILSTLQRMYRHFYIRLCDVADIGEILSSNTIDFGHLRSLSSAAGIWEGVATYLTIVSQYTAAYSDREIVLPLDIRRAARFGAEDVRYRRCFLRVPILPHSLQLYASELKSFLRRGDFRNGLRLGLLPCLATAAAFEQKITGSDKGIW